MEIFLTSCLRWSSRFGFLFCLVQTAAPAPVVSNPNLSIRHVINTATSDGAKSIRLVKDPRNNQLYYLKDNGDIYQLNLSSGGGASTSSKVFTSADHSIKGASGLAIGPDGTFFVVGNTSLDNNTRTLATVARGVADATGQRVWSDLARTEPYPRSNTYFNHVFNGIVVSPDGQFVYLNSGSRTDHGEEQTFNGLFPNTREVPLTTKIFRLPANGQSLTLRNDLAALRSAGYIFADGIRNSYDLAFAPNGDLFGAENGPDRDTPDELNWLREGQHYGFPWRMGGQDTPQQFSNYDPTKDKLIDSRYTAVYRNDPNYPPVPTPLAEPVINVGPEADKFREPADGQIKDASDLGVPFSTFTPHRSPLGLVFDVAGSMAPPFQRHGFVLSWTKGDPNGTAEVGPFQDASQDLLDLELTKLGTTNYQARVTRIAGGFSNPIDAEIIRNKIYVIEYGGDQGVWEVTFPVANTPPALSDLSDVRVNRDQATGPIGFTVGDAETALESLQVTASSSNKILVPDENILLSSSANGANRSLAVVPARDQTGQTTITLTVTDGGNKTASTSFVLTVTPTSIVHGDFNQDGRADLVFQSDDGFLAFWSMNGTQLASASFLNPSHVGDAGFRAVGSGDFNGDRDEDIVFQHADGTLAVWFMQGTGMNSAALLNPSHPGDRNWRVAATADVNRDGQPDLVFQHADGNLAAWQMNGAALARASLLDPAHPGDANWKVAGAGDVNGDGQADLIFQHTDGTLAAWRMDGTKLTTASLLDPPHPGDVNWRVVAVGQYGQSLAANVDLIFQHRDYTLAIWFLEGTKLKAAQLLNPPNSGATWRVAAPK